MGQEILDDNDIAERLASKEANSDATKLQLNIDWNQVNLEEIQLPEGEDFGYASDDEEEEEEFSESDTGFGNIIVVDNIPIVLPEKYEKLVAVIQKVFSKLGSIRENGLWMPVDSSTNKTKGYAFIEFATVQEAQTARDQMNGYKLDKSHIFQVNMFDEFEKYMKVTDVYSPPPKKEYTSPENIWSWLTDEVARDQFVIRYASETQVYWNDARQGKPDPVYQRSCWTETFVQWSPLGTYLATIHRQGAALWGGPNWQRLMRFNHPQVRLIDFSPGEKFLVTYSSHEPVNPRDSQRVTINIMDIRNGKSLREFKGSADEFSAGGVVTGVQWPVFRWAGGKTDKYFARLAKNAISIYETDTMSLLDKKSIKIENVQDFCWSPSEPIFAIFIPEGNGGNTPARVSLMSIPSKTELRQKNLFSVSECKMWWQSMGEYLAVKVERYTKTRKSTHSGFELFRIKDKDIPIEVMELENQKDKVLDFAWEPKGHRFAIIHGDGSQPSVSFYSMKSVSTGLGGMKKVTKLATLEKKAANSLFWSPAGRFIILAGLKGLNGQLEFYNVDDLESMATDEHFMATDVDWDPTGRFVATYVTSVHQMENGFNVWSFNGTLLYRIPKDRFVQFLWRPRPPTLLSAEKEAEIAKNLRRYSKKYEIEDEEAGQALGAAEMERRRSLIDSWRSMKDMWQQLADEEKSLRESLRGGIASDEEVDYEAEVVEVEEIIDIKEEIMNFEA